MRKPIRPMRRGTNRRTGKRQRGYAPFGNIRPSHDLVDRYERTAEKICYDYSMSYEAQKNAMHNLQQAFIMEVCNHE